MALLHALNGAAALVVSRYTETALLGSSELIKALGFAVLAGGTLLFIVCVISLKGAFLGDVERFGQEWEDYAAVTYFILPTVY